MSPDPAPLPTVSQPPALTRGVEHLGVGSSGGGRAEAEPFWEREERGAVTGGHQRCGGPTLTSSGSLDTYPPSGCSFGAEARCWQPPAAPGLGGQSWCLRPVGAAGLCSSPPRCLFCGAARASAWGMGFLTHPNPTAGSTLTSGSGPGYRGSRRCCGRSGPSGDRETRVTSGAGLGGPGGPPSDLGEDTTRASPSGRTHPRSCGRWWTRCPPCPRRSSGW